MVFEPLRMTKEQKAKNQVLFEQGKELALSYKPLPKNSLFVFQEGYYRGVSQRAKVNLN